MSYLSSNVSKLFRLIDHKLFHVIITKVVILNTIVFVLQTYEHFNQTFGVYLSFLDKAIITFFLVEMGVKLSILKANFFKDRWNIFDLVVVVLSIVPVGITGLAALRILRLFRIFVVLSLVPRINIIITTIIRSLSGVTSAVILTFLFCSFFALLGVDLFKEKFPNFFGDFGKSLFTLFQVATFEGWAMEVARPVMAQYPSAWLFFIVFIIVISFTLLNVFVGVIVDAIEQASFTHHHKLHNKDNAPRLSNVILEEIHALQGDVQQMLEKTAYLNSLLEEQGNNPKKVLKKSPNKVNKK